MGEKKITESSLSLSKERKIARKKEIAQMKRNKVISKVVSICVAVAVVGGIGAYAGYKIYRNATKVVASSDFSQGIKEDGFIEGVTAKDYVELCDYNNITVTDEDVSYTDEDLAADIKKLVDDVATLDKETDAAIVDGQKVNIDYVGTIDGEEFDGGNTNGQGSNVTIGSGDLIDDFEQQLIGHKIGDNFTVDVTFPEDYENDETLAGKDASFDVTINGIYVAPEFDDAFVKENFSDKASTAEEYKEYYRDKQYNDKLETWLDTYLVDNSNVTEYPDSYIDDLKAIQKHADYYMYEYLNAMYEQNYGMSGFATFEKYVGESEAKYDKGLAEEVKPTAKKTLVYQAILENEGITVTEEDYLAYLETQGKTSEDYESEVAEYGKGYVMQEYVKIKAIETVKALLK